jgi:hypothetical protein
MNSHRISNHNGAECVLLEIPLRTHGSLALVQSNDDICIKRDGQLVEGCFWRASEMSKAIDEFRHLSHLLEDQKLEHGFERASAAHGSPPN